MSAIIVSNLGKAYKNYPTRLSRLKEWLDPRHKPRHKLHWVLQDINFTVHPGEALGIVGINGAGKSTLLKIVTGTTQASTGNIKVNGRISALLELGMGFHPEFTGRQNVYMAGQLLGYSAEEISQLMPEIEAFAEIGEYIDQAVRVYSSGMQMRLAFSVATARRPDILIVDEALSVGDTYFQHKSFERIREFSKLGTTLLIVSHDKQAIQSICDKTILLSAGKLVMEGKPEAVMDYYNARLADHQKQEIKQVYDDGTIIRTESGSYEAKIVDVKILDKNRNPVSTIKVGQAITVTIKVSINEDIDSLVLGFGIKDKLGQMIFGTNTSNTGQKIKSLKKGSFVNYEVAFNANLGEGSHSIHCSLVAGESHIEKNYHWIDRLKIFEIVNIDKPKFAGSSWNEISFKILR